MGIKTHDGIENSKLDEEICKYFGKMGMRGEERHSYAHQNYYHCKPYFASPNLFLTQRQRAHTFLEHAEPCLPCTRTNLRTSRLLRLILLHHLLHLLRLLHHLLSILRSRRRLDVNNAHHGRPLQHASNLIRIPCRRAGRRVRVRAANARDWM